MKKNKKNKKKITEEAAERLAQILISQIEFQKNKDKNYGKRKKL